jgi:hypothetical protein
MTFGLGPLLKSDRPPAAQKLRDLGYQPEEITMELLRKRLYWQIDSGIDPGERNQVPRFASTAIGGGCRLVSWWEGRGDISDRRPSTPSFTTVGDMKHLAIEITLSGEFLYPLLVSAYSQSEKMTVSFVAASTMLHELAVS